MKLTTIALIASLGLTSFCAELGIASADPNSSAMPASVGSAGDQSLWAILGLTAVALFLLRDNNSSP